MSFHHRHAPWSSQMSRESCAFNTKMRPHGKELSSILIGFKSHPICSPKHLIISHLLIGWQTTLKSFKWNIFKDIYMSMRDALSQHQRNNTTTPLIGKSRWREVTDWWVPKEPPAIQSWGQGVSSVPVDRFSVRLNDDGSLGAHWSIGSRDPNRLASQKRNDEKWPMDGHPRSRPTIQSLGVWEGLLYVTIGAYDTSIATERWNGQLSKLWEVLVERHFYNSPSPSIHCPHSHAQQFIIIPSLFVVGFFFFLNLEKTQTKWMKTSLQNPRFMFHPLHNLSL